MLIRVTFDRKTGKVIKEEIIDRNAKGDDTELIKFFAREFAEGEINLVKQKAK